MPRDVCLAISMIFKSSNRNSSTWMCLCSEEASHHCVTMAKIFFVDTQPINSRTLTCLKNKIYIVRDFQWRNGQRRQIAHFHIWHHQILQKKIVKYPPNLKHDSLLFQATSEYRIMSGKPKFQFYRFLSIRNAQEMSIHDNLNLDFRNI